MKFSDRVYYRRVYFALPAPKMSISRSVFVSLVKGEKKNILIDSGVSYNYPDLVAFCGEAGLKLEDIDILLLTHYHPDHIGGLYRLQQDYPDLQIWAHAHCKEMVEDPAKHFAHRPLFGFHYLVPGPATVAHVLEDNEEIDAGGVTLKVIYTPGHSMDSVSFYIPEESLILAGDALPPIGHMPIYDDVAATRASIERLKALGAENLISSFTGLWDNAQGNCYDLTLQYMDQIQEAVNAFAAECPNGSAEELAGYVLTKLGIHGNPMPLVLNTLKRHLPA